MAFGSLPGDEDEQPLSEINMIPMIDVMLVLLIVFMITAPLLTNAVKLDLPKASSQLNQPKPEAITLSIDSAARPTGTSRRWMKRRYWPTWRAPAKLPASCPRSSCASTDGSNMAPSPTSWQLRLATACTRSRLSASHRTNESPAKAISGARADRGSAPAPRWGKIAAIVLSRPRRGRLQVRH